MPESRTSNQIREERAKVIANARLIIDNAEADERELTEEETAQFNAMMGQADEAEAQAEEAERKEKLAKAEASLKLSTGRKVPAVAKRQSDKQEQRREFNRALRSWFTGDRSSEAVYRAQSIGIDITNREINLKSEFRDLNIGTPGDGGYTVPEQFSSVLTDRMAYFAPIREVANVLKTASGSDLPWPNVDYTGAAVALTAEAADPGDDGSDAVFSTSTLKSYKFSTDEVVVSRELIQDSAFDIAGYLAKSMGTQIGRKTGTAYATGTGSGQPQGYVTAANSAATIPYTALTYGDLIELYHSVDKAYRDMPGCYWFMHDATVAYLREHLVDGDNRLIWQESARDGEPGLLLGKPVIVDNNMPQLNTHSAKVLVFGNVSEDFIIRDSGDVTIRFDGGYSRFANDQLVWMGSLRTDSRYVGFPASSLRCLTTN